MLNFAMSLVGLSSATSGNAISDTIDLQSPSPKRSKSSHANSAQPSRDLEDEESNNERIGIRKLGTSPFCLSQKKTKLFKDEEGYMYHKDRTVTADNGETTYYYRCKVTKCPARFTKLVDASGENVLAEGLSKPHLDDCQPDPDDVLETVREFKDRVFSRVGESSVSLGAAYRDEARKLLGQFEHLPEGEEAGPQADEMSRAAKVLKALPAAKSLATTASRIRNDKFPPQPADPNMFVNSLPESLKEGTFFGEKFRFYQKLLQCPQKPDCIAVIFGDLDSLRRDGDTGRLQRLLRLYVDGTFKIVPQPFAQLFTIGYVVQGRMFPAVYALLTNKRTETYRLVFDYLFSYLTVDGTITPALESIMSDFEHQIRNAIAQAAKANSIMKDLPLRVDGCYFHYVQALHHNAKELSLCHHLKENMEGAKYYSIMKLLAALANLRVEHVRAAYDEIKARYKSTIERHASLSAFFQYYEREWLSDIEKWNVFDALSYRTNNHMEGWHRGINEAVKNRTRNIWLFVQTLLEECIAKKLEYQQFMSGLDIRPRPSKQAKDEERILGLKIAHYKTGMLQPWDFLKSVANIE